MYRLEYTAVINEPIIEPRPWWKLWGRDKIGYAKSWKRVELRGLSPAQAEHIQLMHRDSALSELLVKLVALGVTELVGRVGLFTEEAEVGHERQLLAPEQKGPPQLKPWQPSVRGQR